MLSLREQASSHGVAALLPRVRLFSCMRMAVGAPDGHPLAMRPHTCAADTFGDLEQVAVAND